MNYSFCFNTLGSFLRILGVMMLIPSILPMIQGEEGAISLAISAVITFGAGMILVVFTREKGDLEEIDRKSGFLVATLFWVGASIFGALPYLAYGTLTNPVDAIFEATTGFTTTGSTVIPDVESLPYAISLWRHLTQWVGGMGIVVLAIAVLPRLAIGGGRLMALEAPGPSTERLTPKIAETAKSIWFVYVALSFLLIAILLACGMSPIDAVAHSFSTMSTGGLSTLNQSVGGFNSVLIEIVIMIFMFISGMNFVIFYLVMKGKWRNAFKGEELKLYFFITIAAIVIVLLDVWRHHNFPGFSEALRHSAFQVISTITTTGFTSTDFIFWPPMSLLVLSLLMVVGGCSGSTSGAMKQSRAIIILKKCYDDMRKMVYPNLVSTIRFDGKKIDSPIISNIASFFIIYLITMFAGAMLISLIEHEHIGLGIAFSAAIAAIGNAGAGAVPNEYYAGFENSTKLILSALMIIGRLEIYTILVLLIPDFWRK